MNTTINKEDTDQSSHHANTPVSVATVRRRNKESSMNQPAAIRPNRSRHATTSRFRFLSKIAFSVLAVVPLAPLLSSNSAAALTSIQPPANYTCGNAKIAVSPPRAWANPGRTEQVMWANQVERYNSATRTWYVYATYINYGSFNQFGQNVTSWSMGNTNRGGMYINSRLHLPVSHQGYYRVVAVVGNATMGSTTYVGGTSNYCWMP